MNAFRKEQTEVSVQGSIDYFCLRFQVKLFAASGIDNSKTASPLEDKFDKNHFVSLISCFQ